MSDGATTKRQTWSTLAAFACGLLFALGLGLSGMTHPARILGFLDVFGVWDPTLIFTMAGAIGVHMPLLWLVRRRSTPFLAPRFELPTKKQIDTRLIGGSAVFGVGWALGGFCPGPAVVSVFGGCADNLVFFVALVGGMALRSLVPGPVAAGERTMRA
jgi:uncharacterized membrane protein YedE/YeeE